MFPHQLEAIKWMSLRENSAGPYHGGVLAHDMGMGKTRTTLTFIDSSPDALTLIVCPKSVIQHWCSEIKKSTSFKETQVHIYHGVARRGIVSSSYDSNAHTINRDSSSWHYSVKPESIATDNQRAKEEPTGATISPGQKAVVITTFDIVRIEGQKKKENSILFQLDWDRILVDEAHRVCEQGSKTSKSLCKLKSYKRWCVTGTPFKNGVGDIEALCKFINITPFNTKAWWCENLHNKGKIEAWRGLFMHIRKKTKQQLLVPFVSDLFCTMLPGEVETQSLVKMGECCAANETSNNSEVELLKILRLRQCSIHPLVALPVSKKAIRALSNSETASDSCQMCLQGLQASACDTRPGKRRRLTHQNKVPVFKDLITSPGRVYCQDGELTSNSSSQICKKHAMCSTCLAMCRICALCAVSKLTVAQTVWPHSAKTRQLLDIVSRHSGSEKIVVFSQWTSALKVIDAMLEAHGFATLRYDGNISKIEERGEVLREFAESTSTNILTASIGAGGEGIDITCANVVVLMEPYWNTSVEKQAIDRVHRIGQTKQVYVYRLILRDSIDEWVLGLQSSKKAQELFYLTKTEAGSDMQQVNACVSKKNSGKSRSGKGDLTTSGSTWCVDSACGKSVGSLESFIW